MDQKDLVYLGIGIAVAILLAVVAILTSGKKTLYKRSGQLLLVNEQRFLTAALQALPPDTLLTFKVKLSHIVTSRDATTGKNMDKELLGYSLDFVLVDRNTSDVKLCIELLMEGRDKSGSVVIDRALRRSKIPHLKLPLVRFYDPMRLRQLFVSAIKDAA